MAESIFDFFTREAGQKRRRALDDAVGGLLEYLTPPNLRPAAEFAAQVNPIQGMSDSMAASGVVFDPEQTAEARKRAALDMGMEMAFALTPAALAARGYLTPVQGVMEGLLGGSPAQKVIANNIVTSEPSKLSQSADELRKQANIQKFGYDPNDVTDKITAYHGSPHTFDRFDMSKLGTGEGAQAYGRGLYFAENEKVAKDYRDSLSRGLIAKVGDTPVFELYDNIIRQADSIKMPSDKADELYEKAAFLEDLEVTGSFDEAFDKIEFPDVAKWAKSEILPKYQPAGNIYKVDINADVDKFIDYDARLSDQSDFVKNAFENIPKGNVEIIKQDSILRPYKIVGTNWKGGRVERSATSLEQAERVKRRAESVDLKLDADQSGASVVGQTAYNEQKNMIGLLQQRGIEGIRYLDQGSRGMGYEVKLSQKGKPYETEPITAKTRRDAEEIAQNYEEKGFDTNVQQSGSRNLVVFDDRIIEIVKKYGIAGAALLLGVSTVDIQGALAQGTSEDVNTGLLQ